MLIDFQNSVTDRLTIKFAIKLLLNIRSCLKNVVTLPCEIPMFKKFHAQELSEASCHARLSHSKQLLKKILYIDVIVI